MNTKRQLGQNLRSARHACGLTQAALAERIGKSVETVSNIERGNILPGVETLVLMADALGVPPASLFAGIGAGSEQAPRVVGQREERIIGLAAKLDDAAFDQLVSLAALLVSRSNNSAT